MNIIIYTRFSSTMQRKDSCADQERNIRNGLKRMGLSGSIEVVKDEAVSGANENRPGYARIQKRIEAGEAFLLAVDDQSRLSRSAYAKALIQDLVCNGGRFLAVSEGIDTEQEGWEIRVGVGEIHNSITLTDTARRVRRGQEGRVLDGNGSAGDLAYGYRAEFVDPAHASYDGRGPKPRKKVVIHDEEAAVVREVFTMYRDGMSMTGIAKTLTRRGVPKGRRSPNPTSPWHHSQVVRMLENKKYIGIWQWGKTRTRKNSRGRKRQEPVAPDEVTRVERPDLRIVDQALWDAVEKRRQEVKTQYGYRPGQKRRGAKRNWNRQGPQHLLSLVLRCGTCGGRMNLESGSTRRYVGCANHRQHQCAQAVRVPKDRGEAAVLKAVQERLSQEPTWYASIQASMEERLAEIKQQVPQDLQQKEKQLTQLQVEVRNLTNALAQGIQSEAVTKRLADAEEKSAALHAEIEQLRANDARTYKMPDEDWIRRQLGDLRGLLEKAPAIAAPLLQQLVGYIDVEEVTLPGKKRGYPRLRFRLPTLAMLRACLTHGEDAGTAFLPDMPEDGEEICIDLGSPSRMDHWAPKIHTMREQGLSWRKIGKRSGLGRGNAYTAWKRWHKAVHGE